MAVSPGAADLESYAKLLGGNMIYLGDQCAWIVSFPVSGGRAAQVRIDEGTPLSEAIEILADAYQNTHRRKSDV